MNRLRALLFPPPDLSDRDAGVPTAMGFSILGVVAQGAVRFGYSVLIARFAGKEVLGDVNLNIALALILVLCWPQAAGVAATKFIAMARGRRDQAGQAAAAGFAARIALVGTLGLAAAAATLSLVALDSSVSYAISVAALVVSLAAYNVAKGVRAGNNRFATTAAWDLVSSIVSISLVVAALVADLSQLLLWPLTLGYAVAAISGWPRAGQQLESRERRSMLEFTGWNSIHIVAAGGLLQLALLLTSGHATPKDLGDFAAAAALATPIGLLSVVMRTSLTPSVSRMFASGDLSAVRTRVDLLMRSMVFLLMPVFTFAVWASDWLLRQTFGAEFASARDVLVLLLIGVSFTSFDAAHVRLNSTHEAGVRQLAACNVAGLVVGVAIAVVAGPRFGVHAAAAGFLAGSAVSALAGMAIVWRLDAMPWRGLLLKLLLGYALMAAGYVVFDDRSTLWCFALLVAGFVAVWTTLGWRDAKRLRGSVRGF